MDIEDLVMNLQSNVARIKSAIARLEKLHSPLPADPKPAPARRNRPGRKWMPREERQQVSKRMKEYWARRKKQ